MVRHKKGLQSLIVTRKRAHLSTLEEFSVLFADLVEVSGGLTDLALGVDEALEYRELFLFGDRVNVNNFGPGRQNSYINLVKTELE